MVYYKIWHFFADPLLPVPGMIVVNPHIADQETEVQVCHRWPLKSFPILMVSVTLLLSLWAFEEESN